MFYLSEQYLLNFIELNLSCPNIIGKPQIGYDFVATDELLRKVFEINSTKHNIGLNLLRSIDLL